MPVHDWTNVDSCVFHHFHFHWISEIYRALNSTLLPTEYYALAEQRGAKFEADILTLRTTANASEQPPFDPRPFDDGGRGLIVVDPKTCIRAESDLEYYRRKQDMIAVRHESVDELVAVIEIVSKGDKSERRAIDDFVAKAASLIGQGIHLLIADLQPPTSRDPQGIHGRIWDDLTGDSYEASPDKPLTVAAYEAGSGLRAFIEPVSIGEVPAPMPLFLRPGGHILIPMEETYQAAWECVPRRWRDVIEPPA